MKNKLYITTLFSHLAVLLTLLAPVIRMTETRMNLLGEKESFSYYVNVMEFLRGDIYSISSIQTIILILVHILGIANAIAGIARKEYSHLSINCTIICGFASALMGALHLYSKSYVLFAVCAISFFAISFCSIKLVKSEK